MKKYRTCSPAFTSLCYNCLHYNLLNFLRAVHRLSRHTVVYRLIFKSAFPAFWVLISAVPPGARTFYNIRARMSLDFGFSPDEDSSINCRNVGKFLTCFMLCFFTASRVWLKFECHKYIFNTVHLLPKDLRFEAHIPQILVTSEHRCRVSLI